jgi:biopolymer transport protein ExbD
MRRSPGSRGARFKRTVTVRPVRNSQAHINVTPLVDVVLVLLIIFMVMTPLMERGLPVQLASQRRVQQLAEGASTQVLVAVAGNGRLRVNSQVVERGEYVKHLRELLRGRAPDTQVVFVVASDDTSYASLVEAIDRAKQAGAVTIGFAPDLPP